MKKNILLYIGVLLLVLLCFALIGYHKYDTELRCKPMGYEKVEAENHAKHYLIEMVKKFNFPQNKSTFDASSRSNDTWSFEYTQGACRIYINVNSCGEADIGGLTAECATYLKK